MIRLKALSNINKVNYCTRKFSGKMEKVSAFDFMLLQSVNRISFILRDGDNLLLKNISNNFSEWIFRPNSIVLFCCLQEQIKNTIGLMIKNLLNADIYKYKNEYVVIYSTKFDKIKLSKFHNIIKISELGRRKFSPLIRLLFQERIIHKEEEEYRWVISRRSISAEIFTYREIEDKFMNRVGILPYIIRDFVPYFFLGFKNVNGSGLTDWGGKALGNENVKKCLAREFKEEFGSSFPFEKDLERALALIIKEKNFNYCLIFLEIYNFEKLEQNFIKTYEIKGVRVLPWEDICFDIYNGKLDGSLAFQIQEIKRFGGLIFSSTLS